MKLQLVISMVHQMSGGSFLLGLRPFVPETEDTTRDLIKAQLEPMMAMAGRQDEDVKNMVDKIVDAVTLGIEKMRLMHPDSSYPLPMLMQIDVPKSEYERWGRPSVGAVLELSMEPAKAEAEPETKRVE